MGQAPAFRGSAKPAPRSPLTGRRRCAVEDCRRLAPAGGLRCRYHPAPDDIKGKTEPRLWTPPLRPLTRETTRGFECVEFADMIGEPFLEWQKWLAVHALELTPLGTYRFRIVVVLVARQNGKSSAKRTVSLWRLYLDGARTVLGTAQDVALAREQMNLGKATIYGCPDLMAEWGGERNVNGDEMYWLADDSLPPGAPREAHPRYVIRATNRKAGRGLSIDELNIDELREQHDWKAWSAISKTVMARPYAQIWVMSNAGDDESVVLNQLRDAAGVRIGPDGVAYLDEARDPSIGIFEWSAPEGCELDDWDAIAQANPALGYTVSASAIMSALGTDPPEVYRTEVLCQRVEALDSAVDATAWKACRDPAGTMKDLRPVVACFDVSPDDQHATLAAAALLSDGRVRVAVVRAWKDTATARSELPGVLKELAPSSVVWYPSGPAAAFAPVLRPRDLKAMKGPNGLRHMSKGVEYIELSGLQVAEACQGLANLTRGRLISHPSDPLIDAHVVGSKKLPSGDGWRFTRRGAGHCDAAYAVAGGAHIALTQPIAARPRIRTLSA